MILNDDGSIYHLKLLPSDISHTIVTVGDPDRVSGVSKHFDSIEVSKQRREFKTETGKYKGKRITVISTGIGTDNIDIVFNELDALVNIDLKNKTIKEQFTSLTFIRIGTSGAIQADIAMDSFLVTETAIGFDNLLHFYGNTNFLDTAFSKALVAQTSWNKNKSIPYVVKGDSNLLGMFLKEDFIKGTTATNVGFYGPQGRKLRLGLEDGELNNKLERFNYQGTSITNLEMETSGIYGMAALLGHKAISLNAIIANRALGTFSDRPKKTVDSLIKKTLDILVKSID
ncbi:nucleoside phosphorylase [Patiriisocius sp. Uisw_017]|uniref:nucleoside phosphorylase n=1 Tax=Patiriisocius sp. Uisw_017 TaxID=3230968 RepID=UPI0039ECE147